MPAGRSSRTSEIGGSLSRSAASHSKPFEGEHGQKLQSVSRSAHPTPPTEALKQLGEVREQTQAAYQTWLAGAQQNGVVAVHESATKAGFKAPPAEAYISCRKAKSGGDYRIGTDRRWSAGPPFASDDVSESSRHDGWTSTSKLHFKPPPPEAVNEAYVQPLFARPTPGLPSTRADARNFQGTTVSRDAFKAHHEPPPKQGLAIFQTDETGEAMETADRHPLFSLRRHRLEGQSTAKHDFGHHVTEILPAARDEHAASKGPPHTQGNHSATTRATSVPPLSLPGQSTHPPMRRSATSVDWESVALSEAESFSEHGTCPKDRPLPSDSRWYPGSNMEHDMRSLASGSRMETPRTARSDATGISLQPSRASRSFSQGELPVGHRSSTAGDMPIGAPGSVRSDAEGSWMPLSALSGRHLSSRGRPGSVVSSLRSESEASRTARSESQASRMTSDVSARHCRPHDRRRSSSATPRAEQPGIANSLCSSALGAKQRRARPGEALPPPDQDETQSVSSVGSVKSQSTNQSSIRVTQVERSSLGSKGLARRDPTPSTTKQSSFLNPSEVAANEQPRHKRRLRGACSRAVNDVSANWMPSKHKAFYKGASSNHDHYRVVSYQKARDEVPAGVKTLMTTPRSSSAAQEETPSGCMSSASEHMGRHKERFEGNTTMREHYRKHSLAKDPIYGRGNQRWGDRNKELA